MTDSMGRESRMLFRLFAAGERLFFARGEKMVFNRGGIWYTNNL